MFQGNPWVNSGEKKTVYFTHFTPRASLFEAKDVVSTQEPGLKTGDP